MPVEPYASVRWTQSAPAFVAARLRAAVPGARWDRPGAECGLVQLWLDGAYHQDVILVQGEEEADYERLLGELPAGEHLLEARPHPGRAGSAPPPRPPARILALEPLALRPQDGLEQAALRHCPWIYTRAERDPWESLWTDTPLCLFYRPRDGGIEFQCVYSNEDGGTDTRGLLAQWGRTVDIEWVLHVPFDPAAPATIQGRGHRTEVHSGHAVAGRRTLQVVGVHGMVSGQAPWGAMRCLLLPRFRWDDRLPREVCLDEVPWVWRVAALEMVREGKLAPGSDAADPVPGDLRDYAYVQVLRRDLGAPPVPLEIRLHLTDGRVCSSTHGDPRQAIARPTAFSTAVKLPPHAAVRRVEAVPLRPVPAGGIRLQLYRLFRLDAEYRPMAPSASGSEVLLCAGDPGVCLWEVGRA